MSIKSLIYIISISAVLVLLDSWLGFFFHPEYLYAGQSLPISLIRILSFWIAPIILALGFIFLVLKIYISSYKKYLLGAFIFFDLGFLLLHLLIVQLEGGGEAGMLILFNTIPYIIIVNVVALISISAKRRRLSLSSNG